MDIHSYTITIFDTLQTQANNQKNHNSMKEANKAIYELEELLEIEKL